MASQYTIDINLIIIAIFIIVIITSSFYLYEGFGLGSENVSIKSNIDGREYSVRNLHDKQYASDMLALIRSKLVLFVKYLKTKHGRDSPRYEDIKRIVKKFSPNNISENPDSSKHTSYSVNKGEKIVLCVRQRDESNKLCDINTMMFVAIHELAHIMTVSIGHTEEFWENMKFLLKEAISSGLNLYDYHPYHSDPVPYCGTMITDTPLKLEE